MRIVHTWMQCRIIQHSSNFTACHCGIDCTWEKEKECVHHKYASCFLFLSIYSSLQFGEPNPFFFFFGCHNIISCPTSHFPLLFSRPTASCAFLLLSSSLHYLHSRVQPRPHTSESWMQCNSSVVLGIQQQRGQQNKHGEPRVFPCLVLLTNRHTYEMKKSTRKK